MQNSLFSRAQHTYTIFLDDVWLVQFTQFRKYRSKIHILAKAMRWTWNSFYGAKDVDWNNDKISTPSNINIAIRILYLSVVTNGRPLYLTPAANRDASSKHSNIYRPVSTKDSRFTGCAISQVEEKTAPRLP